MEQWKIDIADNIKSWDYFTRSDRDSYGKYGILIKFKTSDRSVNDKVYKTLDLYKAKLCSDIKKLQYTGDRVAFVVGSTQAEEQLKNNLNKIYTEVEKYYQKIYEQENPVTVEKIERQNYGGLLIFVALVAALVWVILVWKPKK